MPKADFEMIMIFSDLFHCLAALGWAARGTRATPRLLRRRSCVSRIERTHRLLHKRRDLRGEREAEHGEDDVEDRVRVREKLRHGVAQRGGGGARGPQRARGRPRAARHFTTSTAANSKGRDHRTATAAEYSNVGGEWCTAVFDACARPALQIANALVQLRQLLWGSH